MVYDYTHPEEVCPGIKPWAEYVDLPPEKEVRTVMGAHEEELCRACGWTTYNETTSSYLPRIRIFHTRRANGLWRIGKDWMLWDRTNDQKLGNDFVTQEFLRAQGVKDIPLVREMRQLSKPTDPVQFTLMACAEGVELASIWRTLPPEQKRSYTQQIASAIRELRQFTSPVPQRVGGGLLEDKIIGVCKGGTPCKSIGKTKEEWISSLEEEIRYGIALEYGNKDKKFIEEKFQEFKSNFPDGGPYVLTHGDLNLTNIIVKDGKIEAIIDWDQAGYYPWWAERYFAMRRGDPDMYQFLGPAFKDIYPPLHPETFRKTIMNPIRQLEDAYMLCAMCAIRHSEEDNLVRPRFCECKPYGGIVLARDIGAEMKHEIDYSYLENIPG